MWTQIGGAIIISLLHGLIPSHWLPLVAIGRNRHWSRAHIMRFTLFAAIAHAGSTVLIGLLVAGLGKYLSESIAWFTHIIPAVLMVGLGIWFIYRHYTHHHFHMEAQVKEQNILWPVLLAMFLSPCLEIEGFYLTLGTAGWDWVLLLSVLYFILTVMSMYLWVLITFSGAAKINSHAWEHNAGIITGVILIISGVIMYFS